MTLRDLGVPVPPEYALIDGCKWPYQWARRCFVGTKGLATRMRQHGYAAPIVYCQIHRLLPGLEVVASGGRYLDAAVAAGYPDQYSFAKACKRVLGVYPSAFRRRSVEGAVRERLAA